MNSSNADRLAPRKRSGCAHWLVALLFLLPQCINSAALAHDGHHDTPPTGKGGADEPPLVGNGGGSLVSLAGGAGCSGGFAGPYPCHNVNLHSYVTIGDLGGGGQGNDVWGWSDPLTGKEYALVGRTNRTTFVDVSNPANPINLGYLPRPAGTINSVWSDLEVYKDHVFIGGDLTGPFGLQIFDLTQLRSLSGPPVQLTTTAQYLGFHNSHTVAINTDTGFAYAAGTNTQSGGLHIVDIQNPTSPTFAGGFAADGYTHDTHVVSYQGPDIAYAGREIAFNANEDTLTIVDVTNKSSIVQLSRIGYHTTGYTHQGWLTADQRYLLVDDEGDEQVSASVNQTRTIIWDVADLNAPKVIGFYFSPITAIDHNQFVQDGLVFQANYRGGLRILDAKDIRNADLTEVGYFDIFPDDNGQSFNGAWSAFRFPNSGTTLINGREQGLFVVDTSGITASAPTTGVVNGSFESIWHASFAHTMTDGQGAMFTGSSTDNLVHDLDPRGWIGPFANAAVWNLTNADFPGATDSAGVESGVGVPDGVHALGMQAAAGPVTVRSFLADTLQGDTIYELDVMVGRRLSDALGAGYNIGLYAGDTLLAGILDTDLGAPLLVSGQFVLVSLQVDSRDFLPLLGQPLEIRLSTRVTGQPINSTRYTFFDLVTLESTSLVAAEIPEPATLGLVCTALVGFSARARFKGRRRSSCSRTCNLSASIAA